MDIDLTLAAIQQERNAMHKDLRLVRAARATDGARPRKGGAARGIVRASASLLDTLTHPLPRRRQA